MSYSVEAQLKATGVQAFTSAFNNAASSVQKFKDVGSQMKNVGSTMTKAITLPLAGMGAAVIATGAKFDDQMSTVQAVTGATGGEMDKLRDQAKDLGSSTRFSASEAAEGMEMLSRAGFSTSETMDAIPQVLDLAAAGAVDLGDAADITSNILSGFGMEASETGRVADVLAQASADANTDVEGLGQAFKYVGPIASGVGLSIEDTAAAIGVLGDAGIQGGQAGNMLKRGLLNLASPSTEATELMNKLGVEVFDANGQMKSMPEVLGQLENGLEGMSDQQKLATLETIFGAEAVAGWSALIDAGSGTLGEFSHELENSQGAASDMSDMMEDNLMGSFRSAKSALEGLALSFYEMGEGPIRSLVDWLAEVIRSFTAMDDSTKQTIVIVGLLAAAIGPVLVILGMLIESIASVGTAMTALRTGFSLVSVSSMAWIAVIALVVAAVVNLWQTNEEFRANVIAIWENIKSIIMMVWEAVQPGAQAFIAILGVLIGIMSEVIAIVASVVASFTGWIVSFMETHSWVMQLVAVLGVVIGVIAGVVAIAMTVAKIFTIVVGVVKVAAAIFMFFTSPIGIVIAVVGGLIAIIVALGEKFEWIGNIVDTVSGWVSDAWGGFLNILGIGTSEAADEAGDSIEGLSDSAETSTSKMADSAEANVSSMNDNVSSQIGSMNQFGVMQLTDFSNTGTAQLDNLNIEGISSMDNLSTGAQNSLGDMSAGSTESVSGMNTDISQMLSDLESNGSVDIESLSSNVTGDIGDMSNLSLSEIGDLSSSGASDFSSLESDASSSASNMKSDVEGSFKGMSSTIESEMSNIEKISKSSLKGLSSNFKSSMTEVSKTIQSSMKSVTQQTKTGMKAVSQATKAGMQQTSNAIKQGTTKMTQTTKQGLQKMTQAYKSGFNKIKSTTKSDMNSIVNVSKSGMLSVTSAFRQGMSQSANISQSTGSRITSIFRRLSSQLRSAGVQAMAGLRNGLNSGSGGVMATARSIANRVASTIKKALKVKSPSRVTMAIGEYTAEGLGNGLLAMVRNVDKASDKLALAAVPDMQPMDIAGQVNSINKQASRQMDNHLTSEMNVGKQPAEINVYVGNKRIASEIVDDISQLQNRKEYRNRRKPRMV